MSLVQRPAWAQQQQPSPDFRDEMRRFVRSPEFNSLLSPGAIDLSKIKSVPLVTSLPAHPVVDDMVDYVADEGDGTYWRLRYVGVGTYPWVFVGGSPLRDVNDTLSQTITSASFVDMPTSPGPSVTAPLAGVYRVDFTFTAAHSLATGFSVAAIKNGSAATSDNDGVYSQAHAANSNMPSYMQHRMTVDDPNTELLMQYRNGSGAGTVTLNNGIGAGHTLDITPIMVRRA